MNPYSSGVYLIYCLANSKAYVGSSKKVSSRLASHRYYLRHGNHGNHHLQNAWNKYGEGNFLMGVVQNCSESELITCEQTWIDIWMPSGKCFNNRPKADSPVGYSWSPEARAEQSRRMKDHPTFKGKKHTSSSRALLSEHAKKRTGESNPFYGKTHSDEAKTAIASANTGNTYCVGRKFSDTSKAKMSASQRLRTCSEETKAKISKATAGARNPMFGKRMSEESKNKARATRAANRAAGLHKSSPSS